MTIEREVKLNPRAGEWVLKLGVLAGSTCLWALFLAIALVGSPLRGGGAFSMILARLVTLGATLWGLFAGFTLIATPSRRELPVRVYLGSFLAVAVACHSFWPWVRTIFLEASSSQPAWLFPMSLLLFGVIGLSFAIAAGISFPFLATVMVGVPCKNQREQLLWAALLVTFIGLVGEELFDRKRIRFLHSLAQDSAPLIEAIRDFESEHGHPPETLEELVPGYLPQSPVADSRFGLRQPTPRFANDAEPRAGGWSLAYDTPSGGFNWDEFFYWPSEDYPENDGADNGIERVGRWAYLHE